MAAAAFLKKFMEKITIQAIWQLLHPSRVFNTRGRWERCCREWEALDDAKKERVFRLIQTKRQNGTYINPNPLFAFLDAIQDDEAQQAKMMKRGPTMMDFDAYYKKYGTTEDTDGWTRKFIEDERRTIYVKNNG